MADPTSILWRRLLQPPPHRQMKASLQLAALQQSGQFENLPHIRHMSNWSPESELAPSSLGAT